MAAVEQEAQSERTGSGRLAKVYVEPTSRCNLACRTCLRGAWGESLGDMRTATFARIESGLAALEPVPDVFFGGIGEPLCHPDCVRMVARVTAAGARTELITNGTLLDDRRARGLIDAGLDVLWVSLDGATPEHYADVRLGAALSGVLANLEHFAALRAHASGPAPEIGIAFVAMRSTLADLPALLHLARAIGAARFLITNVLPYRVELCAEVLYARALSARADLPMTDLPDFFLPRMDRRALDDQTLRAALEHAWHVALGQGGARARLDRCPFVEAGALAVGWEGGVSPCLPLLHTHTAYLHGYARHSRRYLVGSVHTQSLAELWDAPEHAAFRARVRAFDFSPCTVCDGCTLSTTNDEDCYGNEFPTCGGCLWAQGVIRCP